MKWLIAVAVLGAWCVLHAQAQQRVCLADIAILVDHSGSICNNNYPPCDPDNWGIIINFLERLVGGLQVGLSETRLSVVSFGNNAKLDFDFDDNDSADSYKKAMRAIVYRGGNTNTTGAIRVARQQAFSPGGGDRPDARNILILLTDGVPTREVADLKPEAERIKREDSVRIVAVGVTQQVDEALLKSLLDFPDEDYIPVRNFDGLQRVIQKLIDQACRTIRPTQPPQPTIPPSRVCQDGVDLTFIMDASGSIGVSNFNTMKNFVKNLIGELDMESGRSKVAVVTFADDVRNSADSSWNLDRYRTRQSAMDAVGRVPYPGTSSRTNTGAALKYAREQIFNGRNGDRANFRNVIVVFTDGGSQNKKVTVDEANLAKAANIHIVSIGIGNWLDVNELRAIASWPYARNYIFVRRFSELPTISRRLRELVCNNINECSSNPCRNGGVCENMLDHYVCKCPPGYAGRNCERTCRTTADVFFVLDASGSIGKENFQREVDFVRDVVYGLNINGGTRVGSLTYADTNALYFNLNKYNNKFGILNAMSYYYTAGTTNTAGAIDDMRNNRFTSGSGDRSNAPNVGVVITDGRSNDESQTWRAAREARLRGITMVAVGIGNNVRKLELEGIASYPAELNKNYFRVNSFTDLGTIRDRLTDAICNNQNECSSNPCRNGGTCTDMINGYVCRCPTGYTGLLCERNCDGKADVIFEIDASGSIRHERFDLVIDFLVGIVSRLEVSENRVRVGAIKFSDTAVPEFYLNSYRNQQDVVAALRRIQFMGGRTNTEASLQRVRTAMFTGGRGDRSDAPNILITFTDGNSNINPERTIPEAVNVKASGVHSIVMAVGTLLNTLELKGIASIPENKNVFTVRRFNDLLGQVNNIVNAFCDTQNECLSNPCRNQAQCINGLGRYLCRCPRNYGGENCERFCSRQKDVVLVLDLSGSVDLVNDLIMNFARRLVYGLDIDSSNMRVGLVSFQSTATVNFLLNRFTTREGAAQAIAFRLAGTRRTNTQEALRKMANEVFSRTGDRNQVENIAVVVTDGNSNIQQQNTRVEAQNARNRGTRIISVGVGPSVNFNELNEIATNPDSEHVFQIATAAQVNDVASRVLGRICR